MQAARWIAGGFSLVFCVAGALFAEESAGRGRMIPERMEIQQARLPEIEAAAAQEREQIDQWYARRSEERTRDISREAAARISYPLRVRWVEFMKMNRGRAYPLAYLDASSYGFPLGPSARVAYLRDAMDHEYFLTEMANLLVSDDFQEKLAQIVQERIDTPLLPLLREEARRLLALVERVRGELTTELAQLQDQKTARLDATMEWERKLKGQVRDILDYLRRQESREPDFGVVESIGYFPRTGYFCMVEGVDRVLEAGDTIGRVRVLRIDREKVEFGRDGDTWAQQLGAPAQPHWR
jgi:hypothetical protein